MMKGQREMHSIYQNLNKTYTLRTERRGKVFVIQKRDIFGNACGKIGDTYATRDEAERELEIYADDSGYRWIGRQDK
jgi:hypothetical protein